MSDTILNESDVYAGRLVMAFALTADMAVHRLAERLIDGGTCTHCGRPTALELFDAPPDDPVPLVIEGREVCWYQYDPELDTIRRGCEGDDR